MAQSVLTRRTQPLAGRTGRTGRTGRIRPILLALGHMGLVPQKARCWALPSSTC